jgi:hyperosmotically inducible periplasmic protein
MGGVMKNKLLGLALGASVTLAGAAAMAGDTGDAWITTKAKISLLTTDGVSGTKINVDTQDGKVTLHGKVPTAGEKSKAETTVKGIEGVKEVKNLLQVVPEERKDAVNATDDSIKDAVEAKLKNDKTLEDVNIASVNQGVVLLSGKAATLNAELKAIELAAGVPGVRRVSSEIEAAEK